MTRLQMEQRLVRLEKTVEELQAKLAALSKPSPRWWLDHAGCFADDPVFDEIVRLGQQYRKSLKPKKRGSDVTPALGRL